MADNAFDIGLEKPLIARRRAVWRSDTEEAGEPDDGAPRAAIAFSGGGIRSAIVSLGLAQALARFDRWRDLDYLSTVSGGGYTGSFLGSLFLPRKPDLAPPDPVASERLGAGAEELRAALAAAQRAQRILTADAQQQHAEIDGTRIVHPLRWLRENGRYLTPGGPGDAMYMAAYYARSLLGVVYVTVVALLLIALAVYVLRLGASDAIALVQPRHSAFDWADLLGVVWMSPLAWLPLAVLLAVIGPLVVAYWIVYRQEREDRRTLEESSIEASPYVLAGASLVAWALLRAHLPGDPLHWVPAYGVWLGLASMVIRNVILGVALDAARAQGAARGYRWITETGAVARARQKLTAWLTAAVNVTFALAALAAVDSLGQTAYRAWVLEPARIGSGGAGVAAIAFVVWRLATWLAAQDVKGWIAKLQAYRKPLALLLAVVSLLVLASIAAALVQAIVWSGGWPQPDAGGVYRANASHGWLLAGSVIAALLLFSLVWLCVGFLNNSTLFRFYAARLVRTFLGAADFRRLRDLAAALDEHDEAAAARVFVSQSRASDDVALRSYYATVSGAPLHLINATLNESVSRTSNLQREDRKGMSLSIGPAGIAVQDDFWRWRRQGAEAGIDGADIGSFVLPPAVEDSPQLTDAQLGQCERLTVGEWAAISGAAVSTGLGALTSAGYSMLIWLVNARLGYWWMPAPVMGPRARTRAMRVLKSYGLVWQEFTGAFLGRRDTYWNLSDGGHFENSAVYELIRRRVPLIFASDNAADPRYGFSDLQNLVRRARLDFGAEIRFLEAAEIDLRVRHWPHEAQPVRAHLGALEDFRTGRESGARFALLAEIAYPSPDGQGELPQRSLLVVIKPTLADFLPVDVRLYGRDHAEFPQQTTADQFFDEAQWESYRKLGYEFGLRLFAAFDALAEDAQWLAQRRDPVQMRLKQKG